jgi:dihydroxyacetone kinase-like protein
MDKRIINTARAIVSQSLLSLAQTQPSLQLDKEYRVISLRNVPSQQVVLISDGGKRYEPAHTGMVGEGLLSGSAAGKCVRESKCRTSQACVEFGNQRKGNDDRVDAIVSSSSSCQDIPPVIMC